MSRPISAHGSEERRRSVRTAGFSAELVATVAEGTEEARRVPRAPHWKYAADHSPSELSNRLGKLFRAEGQRGILGRAFCGKNRTDPADPYSDVISATPAERSTGMSRVIRCRVDDAAAAARLAERLLETGLAESVHPVRPRSVQPVDPPDGRAIASAFPGSWAYELTRIPEALDLEPGSEDVIVAILDSGLELDHPEFQGRLRRGYDFVDLPAGDALLRGDTQGRDPDPRDDTGHGTHVAGVIGARGLRMHAAAGGRARLLPVRVLGSRVEFGRRVGVGIIPDIDDGLKFAVDNGASVINLSLGVQATGGGMPHRRAIEYARLHDVVVVAASGNHGGDEPLFPAAVPGVITVGALTELQHVAGFSGWGAHVDVVAPGTGIYSADLRGGYRYRDGTSHAAPFVAGVAALLIARARRSGLELRERTVRRIIRDTADSPGLRREDLRSGAGVLNALDAVLLLTHMIRAHRRREPAGGRAPDPLEERIAAA